MAEDFASRASGQGEIILITGSRSGGMNFEETFAALLFCLSWKWTAGWLG
jgi:hypothetical protein